MPSHASLLPGTAPLGFPRWSRRKFLGTALSAPLAFQIAPSRILGADAPSNRINLAGVGVGGVGFGQLESCEKVGFRIAALCDVDHAYAKKAFEKWPEARRYRDFRDMLRSEADRIDAVYVGTPDHTHALITVAALRRKKHVCCVKPLTRTIREMRVVASEARKAGVATQVTASPNTSEEACRTCELIQAGVIGTVRELHIWSSRPLWPQGMRRPPGADPVPADLDWKLWLGPAPERPFKADWPDDHYALAQVKAAGDKPPWYKAVYHPFNFRGWWDFGTGALGDMGCHWFNTPFRALQLTTPYQIQASSTKVTADGPPLASVVTYDFPTAGSRAALRAYWYDGGLRPALVRDFNEPEWPDEGVLYVGTEGAMLGAKVLSPQSARKAADVPVTLQRRGGTWHEWYEACRGGEPAGCNFDAAAPLTEVVLLGNVAVRTGRRLTWDAAADRFTDDAANALLEPDYRNGWSFDTV